MADTRLTNKDIQQLIATLNDAGLDSIAEKIEKRIEKSQKLTRSMLKSLDEIRKKENKLYQERLKQQKNLEKSAQDKTPGAAAQLKKIQAEIKAQEGLMKILEKVNIYQERHAKETEKVNNAHSKTPGILKSSTDSLLRYINVVDLFKSAVRQLEGLYNNWSAIQKEIAAGMGQLAQRTGATARQLQDFRQGADRMRDTFIRLGGSLSGWQESLRFVQETALAMRTDMSGLSEEFQMELLATQRGLGLSAEQTAQIVRTLEAGVEGGNESVRDFLLNIRQFSEDIGANAATMAQDFLNAKDAIARFGADGGQAFRNAAQFANHFGFETRRILDLAKQFDSFSNASDNINQLNAMFGTTISSIELMQEQDPVRQLEMITGAIREQGWTWENMTRQHRTALAQNLGFTEDEMARIMRGASMSEIEEQQRQRREEQEASLRRQQRIYETIYDIIELTRQTFFTWGEHIAMIRNELSEALGPIFDAIHSSAEGIANSIREWIRSIARNPDFQNTIRNIAEWISQMPERIKEFLPTWEQIKEAAEEMWPHIERIGEFLRQIFDWALENPETVAVALGAGAAALLLSNLMGVAALFTPGGALLAGVAAFGLALADSMANVRRLASEMEQLHQAVSSGNSTSEERRRLTERGERAALALYSDRMGDGGMPEFARVSGQLLARGLSFFGATDLSREIMDNIAMDDLIGSANYRELSRQAFLGGASIVDVAQRMLWKAEENPDNEVLIRRSFGLNQSEDLREGLLRELANMYVEINPPSDIVPQVSAPVSAVESAPATATTVSAPTTGPVQRSEVIVRDVVLDGNRVGQAFFEISRS